MLIDLNRHTIFVTLAGSHAHGTAGDESDIDFRGVCIAPLSVRLSLFHTFEQFEGIFDGTLWQALQSWLVKHPQFGQAQAAKTESLVFDISKFLRLCADANPNTLEILFSPPEIWLHSSTNWQTIYGERHRFISKKVQQTYLGYGLAQLRKIQTHRAWLLNPPIHKPTREAFGLPETATLSRDDLHHLEENVARTIVDYGIDELEMSKALRLAITERLQNFWRDKLAVGVDTVDDGLRELAISNRALPSTLLAALKAERKYRAALKHWSSYEHWKRERNRARAALEQKFGYDTKHAMHLLRLLQTGLEILECGELRVCRPNAQELVAVRNGKLTFDELLEHANDLELRMQQASKSSTLPDNVDLGFVDNLCQKLIRTANSEFTIG